ncbi:MAG: heparinase II/III family protein [Lachnospiraceae bacterium]|nr:heparinase II/III family protein [Lachnospiraceae bacterium]
MGQIYNSYIRVEQLKINQECQRKLELLYHMYMEHKFDLLGSGYVKIDYDICAKGFAGKRYVNPYMKKYEKKAKRYVQNPDYSPINWFVDYKSGFFFHPQEYDSKEKCLAIIGKKQGVEIKCPWELGRFYHLVQLAVLAVAKKEYRQNIVEEFRNEIMDFIGMNPVGKTVQWSAVMDTAIRVVNLVIAHDILRQIDCGGNCFNAGFEKKFEKLIRQSLYYVMENMEDRGNHYLSNLAGIIFAASYLPSAPWTDACLVFGTQELITQVDEQFHKEGSHYEGSTSYHRLSAEFVVYATAMIYSVLGTGRGEVFQCYDNTLIKGLKKAKLQKYNMETEAFFPQWYLDKIYNMRIFTRSVLKQNNEIVQVGDNDSGRLIRLTPVGKEIEENVLDHRTLLSAICGLFDELKCEDVIREIPLEYSLINSLKKKRTIFGQAYETGVIRYGYIPELGKPYKKRCCLFREESLREHGLLENLHINYFSDFGLLVMRSDRLFLSFVTDTTKGHYLIGHTHNDKMSIEIMVDGEYITRDAGSYIYTSAPAIRNRFRSVEAHNVIRVDEKEQNIFTSLWGMYKNAVGELLYCTQNRVIGRVKYDGVEHIRDIELTESSITVTDYANRHFKVSFHNRIYSVGYGEMRREP